MGAGGGGWAEALGPELAAAAAEARAAVAAAVRAGAGVGGGPGGGGVRDGGGGWAEFRQHAEGFLRAVDWRERWLVGLLAGHLALITAAVRLRRRAGAQTGIFLGAAALIYLAEPINSFLEARWESFSSQNYFDRAGLFISVVLSGPLLLCSLLTLVNLLAILAGDLVKLKRMELRHRARELRRGAAAEPGETERGGDGGDGGGGAAPAGKGGKRMKKKRA